MPPEAGLRECPYCKEEIKADAIRCKHCRSSVAPEKPTHGGTCPYCKEAIHPEAVKCKHCGADVGPTGTGSSGCCEGCAKSSQVHLPGVGFTPTGSGRAGQPAGGIGAWPMEQGIPNAVIRLGRECSSCNYSGGPDPTGIVHGSQTCCDTIWSWTGTHWISTRICWTEACTGQVVAAGPIQP